MNPLIAREPIWNVPLKHELDDRWKLLNHIVRQHLASRDLAKVPVRFLEIGVWHPATIFHLFKEFGAVFDYVAVDPYGHLPDDPYKGEHGFWQQQAEADAVYQKAARVFTEHGAELRRQPATEFFAAKPEAFDIIFVDGDHRYHGALADLESAFVHVKPGGMIILDDYGNSFHPEVEWAARAFYDKRKEEISRVGWHPLFFQLAGQFAPIMLSFVCFERAA